MKYLKLITLTIFAALLASCGNNTGETSDSSSAAEETTERTGQAFATDEESTPNCLEIAIGSPDHTTLVAAVQAAQVENALVNVGPLTVFAPTDEAFAALPEGTVENLVKPENKAVLADILKYHVTPGNLSVDIISKLKKLGQANNQDLQIEVVDGKPMIGGANIIASVKAGNGIVHVVDKVLLPPAKD